MEMGRKNGTQGQSSSLFLPFELIRSCKQLSTSPTEPVMKYILFQVIFSLVADQVSVATFTPQILTELLLCDWS